MPRRCPVGLCHRRRLHREETSATFRKPVGLVHLFLLFCWVHSCKLTSKHVFLVGSSEWCAGARTSSVSSSWGVPTPTLTLSVCVCVSTIWLGDFCDNCSCAQHFSSNLSGRHDSLILSLSARTVLYAITFFCLVCLSITLTQTVPVEFWWNLSCCCYWLEVIDIWSPLPLGECPHHGSSFPLKKHFSGLGCYGRATSNTWRLLFGLYQSLYLPRGCCWDMSFTECLSK